MSFCLWFSRKVVLRAKRRRRKRTSDGTGLNLLLHAARLGVGAGTIPHALETNATDASTTGSSEVESSMSGCETRGARIRVLVVDDHDLFRTDLASLLCAQEDIEVLAQGHARALCARIALAPSLPR
jgi:hypothetical protein